MKTAKTISVFDFFKLIPTPENALQYMTETLFPDGVFCHKCKSKNITQRKKRTGGYRCKECRNDFSIKTGTIFEGSNLGFDKWLFAFYLVQTSRKGISSLQLSKELGITQKSAWFVLHRIREASKDNNVQKLYGIVEIDETYIGGLEKNKHNSKRTQGTQGRSTKTKTAVVRMKQRDGKVKAKSFTKVDSDTLQEYINTNIKEGSILSILISKKGLYYLLMRLLCTKEYKDM